MNSVLIADRPNVTDSLTHTHTYTVLVIRTQINEIWTLFTHQHFVVNFNIYIFFFVLLIPDLIIIVVVLCFIFVIVIIFFKQIATNMTFIPFFLFHLVVV